MGEDRIVPTHEVALAFPASRTERTEGRRRVDEFLHVVGGADGFFRFASDGVEHLGVFDIDWLAGVEVPEVWYVHIGVSFLILCLQ